MPDLYDDPELYDLVAPRDEAMERFYVEVAGGHSRRVLELACGSGRLTVPLAKSGALVTAGDISAAMLNRAKAAARESAVDARFVELDMRDFDVGTEFDVVVIAANSLMHLNTTEDLVRALSAVRIPLNTIRAAMRDFSTSFEDSPGRLNIHDGHGFRVILDYAHNPDGLRALGHLVGKMRERHQRVIGMVGTAGDRRDVDIRAMGELAAGLFDVIVLKEDDMLRGREPGTVAALMQEGALAAGCTPDRIHTVLPEDGATEFCLRLAGPGDLVVLMVDRVEQVWEQINAFDPTHPPLQTAEVVPLRSAS